MLYDTGELIETIFKETYGIGTDELTSKPELLDKIRRGIEELRLSFNPKKT